MNKKTNKRLIYIMIIILILITSYILYTMINTPGQILTQKMDQPPSIEIIADGEAMLYTTGLNEWNGSKYDRQDTLISYMNNWGADSLKYLPNGEEVAFSFLGQVPDKIEMIEVIIGEDGRQLYSGKETKEILLIESDDQYGFKIVPNMAGNLSSHSDTYEQGGLLRGYKLICTWGRNSCEYGFAIRSDV